MFYEITFNLSTMMQAAARAYRLNQTHERCRVVYLFYEATMEHTAVQLMSRKQRAAKLLTGDIGLTGLDALTEGEGGLEEALLAAIGQDETLLDPRELFRASGAHSEIDAEDAAYWNVAVAAAAPEGDPLLAEALDLGGVIAPADDVPPLFVLPQPLTHPGSLSEVIRAYLDTVHIVADARRLAELRARLVNVLEHGVEDEGLPGLRDPDWLPDHAERLTTWVRGWLQRERVVFTGCEDEVAAEVVRWAQAALPPVSLALVSPPPRQAKVDLLAVPDDAPPVAVTRPFRSRRASSDDTHVQLSLF